MGVVAVIDYSEIKDAANKAGSTAKKLDTYMSHLRKDVYNKLNSYDGSHTSNINDAKTKVNNKINELDKKKSAFEQYERDLDGLKTECENVDKAVKTRVSTLTSQFKQAHGIKDSKVENFISYLFTSIDNLTSVGRWLKDKYNEFKTGAEYLLEALEDWWDFEGGKELVKGIVVAALEITIAVCGIIGAIVTGGALIVVIAAVVGGIIAVANGVCNFVNELRAYNETRNNDNPALARIRSKENTMQDTLRRESDEKWAHNLATGIDITKTVCDVIGIIDSVGTLTKNAYKWTTGSMADPDNLRLKDILTKENFTAFGDKLKTTMGSGLDNIKTAIKMKDFTAFKEMGTTAIDVFKSDFKNSLFDFKKGLTNFSDLEHGAKAVKSWSSMAKTVISADNLLEGTFDLGVKDILIDKLVLPNIGFGRITTYAPKDGINGGALAYKDSYVVSFSDIKSMYGDVTGLFDNDFSVNTLDKDVLSKLSTSSNVQINVPEIRVPEIKMDSLSTPKIEIPKLNLSNFSTPRFSMAG